MTRTGNRFGSSTRPWSAPRRRSSPSPAPQLVAAVPAPARHARRGAAELPDRTVRRASGRQPLARSREPKSTPRRRRHASRRRDRSRGTGSASIAANRATLRSGDPSLIYPGRDRHAPPIDPGRASGQTREPRREVSWDCWTARSPSSPEPGRGSGAAHARLLAAEGARVVVNDLGTATAGEGTDATPARRWSTRSSRDGGARRRERRQRRDLGRRRGARAASGRRLRPARHRRQQRRHPARRDELQHHRRRVGLGDRRAPEGPPRDVPPRGRGTGATRGKAGEEVIGPDHQHRERVGPVRPGRPDQLRDRQGRHRLDDDRARPRDEEVRRDRQRRVPARAHAHDRDGAPARPSS